MAIFNPTFSRSSEDIERNDGGAKQNENKNKNKNDSDVTEINPNLSADLSAIEINPNHLQAELSEINPNHLPVALSESAPEIYIEEKTVTLIFDRRASIPNIPISTISPKGSITEKPPIYETKHESSWALTLQIVVTLVVAGAGTVGAGMLLDTVQDWSVYQNVSEMFIMVPPLLGLKGNLEMTLASRLTTLAHLGQLSKGKQRWYSFGGELALTKAQSVVFAFLASFVAVALGAIRSRQVQFSHFLLLCASGMVAAFGASLFLGILIVAVILVSRRCRFNPDNIATPMVASFGDLLTVDLKFVALALHM